MLAKNVKEDKEYLDISGLKMFCDKSVRLILGDEFVSTNAARIASCQSISGTGAVRLGAEFLGKFWPVKVVLSSNPTWGNHRAIFNACGIEYKEYRYWDNKTLGIDEAGFLEDLTNAPDGSIILLHACAHNPTGMDPTPDQWSRIAAVMRQKKHLPFFDSAYQGFASGDLDKDASTVRFFAREGFEMIIAQSYAKNFGLYAERAGCVSVVAATVEGATAALSQLKATVRPMYSNPPKHGALIVQTVLSDPQLFEEWRTNLRTMAGRIHTMRTDLFQALKNLGTPGDWSHIVKQIGMFSYTGLKEHQVKRLVDEFHIYLLSNGRISMAGVNTHNVQYLAKAIDTVVKQSQAHQ
jgi:aspartate aminotransferase, cytoplasmic